MRFSTYRPDGDGERVGVWQDGRLYEVPGAAG